MMFLMTMMLATTVVNSQTPTKSQTTELIGRQLGPKQAKSSSSSSSSKGNKGSTGCPDPKQALLDFLECVGNNDSVCAADAYAPGFEQFHNEVLSPPPIPPGIDDPAFWDAGFLLFPGLAFDIKFAATVGDNLASVRYIETVTSTDGSNLGIPGAPLTDSPFGQVVVQHEDALVQLTDDCKIVQWSQYGDNQEQQDVDSLTFALLCILDPLNTPGC